VENLIPVFAIFATLLLLIGLMMKLSARSGQCSQTLEEQINAMLPQTQCGQCDYKGCRPYARAIAENSADINRCPPGGQDTVRQIARLIGVDEKPLRLQLPAPQAQLIARIDEDLCIGCVKCIRACPVDAIIGAAKQMHSVLERDCTGCQMCLSPCPVNCITMQDVPVNIRQWVWPKPVNAYRTDA
jgi:electron transport complex protein RnfB